MTDIVWLQPREAGGQFLPRYATETRVLESGWLHVAPDDGSANRTYPPHRVDVVEQNVSDERLLEVK